MYPQIEYNCCLFLAHGKNLTVKSTQTTVMSECKSGNAISKLSLYYVYLLLLQLHDVCIFVELQV